MAGMLKLRNGCFGNLLSLNLTAFATPKEKKVATSKNHVAGSKDKSISGIKVPAAMPTVKFKVEPMTSTCVISEPTGILKTQSGRMKHNPDNVKGTPKQFKNIKVVDENNKFIKGSDTILKAQSKYNIKYEIASDQAAITGVYPKTPQRTGGGLVRGGGGSLPPAPAQAPALDYAPAFAPRAPAPAFAPAPLARAPAQLAPLRSPTPAPTNPIQIPHSHSTSSHHSHSTGSDLASPGNSFYSGNQAQSSAASSHRTSQYSSPPPYQHQQGAAGSPSSASSAEVRAEEERLLADADIEAFIQREGHSQRQPKTRGLIRWALRSGYPRERVGSSNFRQNIEGWANRNGMAHMIPRELWTTQGELEDIDNVHPPRRGRSENW